MEGFHCESDINGQDSVLYKVKQGEKLITFDRKLIQSKGFDPVVILIFPNKAVNVNAAHQNLKEHQGIDVKIN